MNKFLLLVGFILLSPIAKSQYYSDSQNHWNFCPNNDCTGWEVFHGDTITSRIIEDPNDTIPPRLYRFCTFPNGIRMSGMDSVYFYGCTFLNSNLQLGASDVLAKTQTWQSCDYVTIDSCEFLNSPKDAIVTIRNLAYPDIFDHSKLIIKNSHFENWGTDHPGDKRFHAVYIKSSNALVENCTMKNIDGGSAITMRSSGIIRGNQIERKKYGMSSITYWNQFPPDSIHNRLIIENNVVYEPAFDSMIQHQSASANGTSAGNIWIASQYSNGLNQIVDSIEVRFNTVIVLDSIPNPTTSSYSGIAVHNIFSDPNVASKVLIYGNLISDLRNDPFPTDQSNFIKDGGGQAIDNDFLNDNFFDVSLDDFQDDTYPFDFHLKCGSGARIKTLPGNLLIPTKDRIDHSRPDVNGELDFGAYQYTSLSPFSGYYSIINRRSGNALRVDGLANYDPIHQYEWQNWSGQHWSFIELCNNRFAIRNKKSQNFIRTDGTNNDSPINQHDWQNWSGQEWLIEDLQNGYYKVESSKSSKVLKIDGIKNNDPIVQYDWQNWTGQHWTIEPLNGSVSKSSATEAILGLENNESIKSDAHIFPNPSDGHVYIEFESESGIESNIIIMDINGKELKSLDTKINRGYNLLNLDLNDLESGIYIILINGLKSQGYWIKK